MFVSECGCVQSYVVHTYSIQHHNDHAAVSFITALIEFSHDKVKHINDRVS